MNSKKLKLEKFFDESAIMALITNGIRLQKELNKDLIEYELNLNQALILLAIFFETEKIIRSHELVTIIPSTKGNISHCTSLLEQKKFIFRRGVANDLRGYEFHLSAKGQKTCISLVKFFDDREIACDKKFTTKSLKDFISMSHSI